MSAGPAVEGVLEGGAAAGVEGGVTGCGGELHEINSIDNTKPKLPTMHESRSCFMGLILLEALLALIVLLLIVWWTMFSGRKKGELVSKEDAEMKPQKEKEDA